MDNGNIYSAISDIGNTPDKSPDDVIDKKIIELLVKAMQFHGMPNNGINTPEKI